MTDPVLPDPAKPTDAAPVKPGYKTTEFWLSLAATILGAAFAGDLIPETGAIGKIAGLAAVVLTALGYAVVRGKAKS